MHPPLRVDAPDAAAAESLRRLLEPFGVETVAVEGRCEVIVDLIERNPDERVAKVLDAIDRWLIITGLASVAVTLDGRVYTISTPLAHARAPKSVAPKSGQLTPFA